MHINMKYYIITICAIFIALGIGIMVGFNINNNQQLSDQQSSLIKELDEKFDLLKSENDELKSNLKKSNLSYNNLVSFLNSNAKKISQGSLADKQIGIISFNDDKGYLKSIKDVIDNGEAELKYSIIFNENVMDADKIKNVSNKLGKNLNSSADLLDYVENAINSNAEQDILDLQTEGLLKIDYMDKSTSKCDSVVIAAGDDNKKDSRNFNDVDSKLIDSLKKDNKHIVEVETTTTKKSYVDLYDKKAVASVDNINQGTGNLSLSILLKDSNIIGKYGISDSSDYLIPNEK